MAHAQAPADGIPWLKSPWGISTAIHFAVALAVGVAAFWPKSRTELVDFEVYVQPKVAGTAPLQIRKPIEKPKEPEKRAVFGQSRTAMTDDARTDGMTAKAGNTVAKEEDDETLRVDDADSLPIPADEYLVSAMPELLREYRIPYPAEAKQAGIQGAVVMDILVDSSGQVRQAVLISGPGYGLDEAALAAVKSFEFKPARVQERPVAVKIRYAYRFVLER